MRTLCTEKRAWRRGGSREGEVSDAGATDSVCTRMRCVAPRVPGRGPLTPRRPPRGSSSISSPTRREFDP